MRTAYAGFAVFFALLLAVWNFPPTERLVLPIAPLWLAGLLTEMKHLAANIAAVFGKPDRGQKFAGALVAVVLSSAFLYCGARQSQLISAGLPKFFQDHVERLQQSEPAMAWIRQNLPSGATFLCENDPLLFLRTGRRGAGLVFLPTIHWYRNDQDARTAGFASAARFATERNLGYFLLNDWDYSRDMPSGQHAKLIRTLKQEPRFELLFRDGPTSVYRLRPAQ
jgi:hypothetical protein